jgi:hypothetical protein
VTASRCSFGLGIDCPNNVRVMFSFKNLTARNVMEVEYLKTKKKQQKLTIALFQFFSLQLEEGMDS